jgi:hypothetical protein
MLNANVHNIKTLLDFNTQQTDFTQIKYLSVTPTFTFQNLMPVPLTLLFTKHSRQLDEI